MLNIFRYKELLGELVKREIKARYKQSYLGYVWVILVPLINLVVLSLVFSFFVRIPTGNTPYPLFLFSALVPWTFTTNAIVLATGSLVGNRSLITKIYFPREVFIYSSVLSKCVDFVLSFIILFVFVFYFGGNIGFAILYLPLVVIANLVLTLGVSFFLSAINVFYRDIENTLGVIVTMWMYLTPVIYPLDIVPEPWRRFLIVNPMVPIINTYRNVLLYNKPPDALFYFGFFISVLIFIFGYLFFKNKSKYFADII